MARVHDTPCNTKLLENIVLMDAVKMLSAAGNLGVVITVAVEM